METQIKHVGGLLMHYRPNTSDLSAIDEVIEKRSYERKYFRVLPGETWVDLGGNIGAFTVLAAYLGAIVKTYEPDPLSIEMIKKNLLANKLTAQINQAGVVGDGRNTGFLSISKTGKYWRNSLYKDCGGGTIKVPLVKFDDVVVESDCVKMDIEGAEMDIVEKMQVFPKKLVLEWSFDIDDNIDRYRTAVSRLRNNYPNVRADKIADKHTIWQKTWFPHAKMIYAWK
jgi:FkbM family methyltransferase